MLLLLVLRGVEIRIIKYDWWIIHTNFCNVLEKGKKIGQLNGRANGFSQKNIGFVFQNYNLFQH